MHSHYTLQLSSSARHWHWSLFVPGGGVQMASQGLLVSEHSSITQCARPLPPELLFSLGGNYPKQSNEMKKTM